MGRPRTDLQTVLEGLLGTDQVYFQPPTNVTMAYPAIVYERGWQHVSAADNKPYDRVWRYQVTVIDKNPDSLTIDKVADLPMTTYIRHFAVDNLNHDVFDVYF
jgi:hypothetical protein